MQPPLTSDTRHGANENHKPPFEKSRFGIGPLIWNINTPTVLVHLFLAGGRGQVGMTDVSGYRVIPRAPVQCALIPLPDTRRTAR